MDIQVEHGRAVFESVISADQCKELLHIHRSCSVAGYRQGVESTTMRHLAASNCAAVILPFVPIRGGLALIMIFSCQLAERIRELVEEAFGCQFQLFTEFTGLISWRKGASIGWHSDSNRPYLQQRHYSAVCYLNDYGADFQGGLFRFQQGQPRTVSPAAGVEAGERCTLAMWFTRDKCHDEDAPLLRDLSAALSSVSALLSQPPPSAPRSPSHASGSHGHSHSHGFSCEEVHTGRGESEQEEELSRGGVSRPTLIGFNGLSTLSEGSLPGGGPLRCCQLSGASAALEVDAGQQEGMRRERDFCCLENAGSGRAGRRAPAACHVALRVPMPVEISSAMYRYWLSEEDSSPGGSSEPRETAGGKAPKAPPQGMQTPGGSTAPTHGARAAAPPGRVAAGKAASSTDAGVGAGRGSNSGTKSGSASRGGAPIAAGNNGNSTAAVAAAAATWSCLSWRSGVSPSPQPARRSIELINSSRIALVGPADLPLPLLQASYRKAAEARTEARSEEEARTEA
eukprot:jgi/Mesen1/5264/ME000263S04371